MEFNNLIQHINSKVKLTKEEETILMNKLNLKTYSKGDYINQEGEINKYQVFIVSGKVRTFYVDANGNEHIVGLGIENWWTGDLCSFSSQTPAEFNAQCLGKTTVIRIGYEDMEYLYVAIPKLERYFRIILEGAYVSMSKRIVRNHSMSAKDRYLQFLERYPKLVQRFPQYMIASYLGITKEFLSSVRKQIAESSRK